VPNAYRSVRGPAIRELTIASPPRSDSVTHYGPGSGISHVRSRWLLFALAIFVCRLVVAMTLIPPWQQPDEQVQVAVAEVWRSRFTGTNGPDPGRQREIVESMIGHDWWRYYGRVAPSGPVPATFKDTGVVAPTIGIDPTSENFPSPFYRAIGGVLSIAPQMPVDVDMYVMRSVSAVLAILTVWIAWLGAREALGEMAGAVVVLLLALHPQFVIVSVAAGPDALINAAGACLWWQAMRALKRPRYVRALAAVWAAGIGAALSDRMGVPLLAAALIVSAIVLIRRTGHLVITAAVTVAITIGTAASLWVVPDLRRALLSTFGVSLMPVPGARSWDYISRWTAAYFGGWWFLLGWARFEPPGWWLLIALAICAASAWGVTRRASGGTAAVRTVILVAVSMLTIQVAAEYWTFLRIQNGPLGKHLLPFVVPSLVLIWAGSEAIVPARYQRHAAYGLVLCFAVLDSLAWIFVALPTYAN
jgi:hypothetical protein